MIHINGKEGVNAIDNQTTLGLSGIFNSLSYRVHEIGTHIHGYSRWFGKSADQSGNDWNVPVSTAGMPTLFRAILGDSIYGEDANDEAKIWGTEDVCVSGDTKFDIHKLEVIATSSSTVYVLRIIWGSGTMADAIAAGQYSEIMVLHDDAPTDDSSTPIDIMMPRITIGTHKIWIQAKNITDNATIDFYVGGHSYIA